MRPTKWYFYNSRHCIDDPTIPISAEIFQKSTANLSKSTLSLDESKQIDIPSFSKSTMRKTISPITEWRPFNPNDNKRLVFATEYDAPIPVGHDRLLFEVVDLSVLRPIYWTLPLESAVSSCSWVFADTLTPIDPSWDESLLSGYEKYEEQQSKVHEIYDKALLDPDLLLNVKHDMEFRQDSDYLQVSCLFFNKNVYVFKQNSSYLQTKGTAQNILSGKPPKDCIAVLTSFDYDEFVKRNKLPSRSLSEQHHCTLPVKNLILIFHGVGQKLSDSYSRVNFVYAIDKLRIQIAELIKSANENENLSNLDGRLLILPVNWRMGINPDDQLDTDSIVVPSLVNVRKPFVDALLDIPLYMSENRRPDMLTAAAAEANRLYELVLKHHPGFEKGGRVHVVGHSMGSLLTGDILTRQPTKLDTKEKLEQAPFKFETYNFFNTGSMLGLFLMLQNQCIIPRAEYERMQEAEPDLKNKPRPLGCFAAKNVYNISHPCDLLSFLMNRTVMGAKDESVLNLVGDNGTPLESAVLPKSFEPINTEQGKLSKLVTASLGWMGPKDSSGGKSDVSDDDPSKSLVNTSGTNKNEKENENSEQYQKNQPSLTTSRDVVLVEGQSKIRELQDRFLELNENGQIDFRIPDFAGFATHYLKMITAHFDYWSNKDLARFLAIECSREPGRENTIPDHRARWHQKH